MVKAELDILNWIQDNFQSSFMDGFMPFVTKLGNSGMIWILLGIILITIPKTRKTGLTVIAALLFELITCNLILKPLIARTRPCDLVNGINLLISKPTDFSFPSGHTASSFAATSALFFRKNKMWIPSFVLSLLIGFSRLYLYVHFPTDIIGGAIIGIILGYVSKKLMDFFIKKVSLRMDSKKLK